MFRFVCKVPLHVHWKSNVNTSSNGHPSFRQMFSMKCLSTLSKSTSKTLDYLIDTSGLSQDSAIKVASQIDLNSATKPNMVLQLFRDFGFSESHIADIITRRPSLLLAKPYKTLKPKLEVFTGIGISNTDLGKIISLDPNILNTSLDRKIIPCMSLLKSFCKSSSSIIALLTCKRGIWIFRIFSNTIGINIEALRKNGVPDTNISKLIMRKPGILSREAEEFQKVVEEVKEMGFDPNSPMFTHGVCAILGMKQNKWISKVAVFKSFGLSDGEINTLFVKQPMVMAQSEEKIRRALDFFLNKMKWSVDRILNNPVILLLSIEKRVVPRCFVIEQVIGEGLVKKVSFLKALTMAEAKFLSDFVMKYQEDIPGLMQMYQKKIGVL